MVHPIIDKYYNYNPYHSRSSKFVQDKGLVTNEKGVNPAETPALPKNDLKKQLGPSNLHDSLARSLIAGANQSPASPAFSPENLHRETQPISDIRQLSSTKDIPILPAKPQEQGNIKKKRKSLADLPAQLITPNPPPTHTTTEPSSPNSPQTRGSYGDPNKIARYFPELNLLT